jgi:hypothetical protein
MTFTEADAQYEVVKQQYLAGALNDDQFDEQLHRLMVLDDAGAWWAKSRENGAWHYYDAVTGTWRSAIPPAGAPLPPTGASPDLASGSPSGDRPGASEAEQGIAPGAASGAASGTVSRTAPGAATNLPKWAAVKPGTVTPPAGAGPAQGSSPAQGVSPTWSAGQIQSPGAAKTPAGPARAISGPAGGAAAGSLAGGARTPSALPGTAQGVPATSGYRPRDFGPVAELTGGMKVLFYVLALFLPLLGLILYFVYRGKPADADRAAARAFLILGIVSLVFALMCGATFFLLESPLLGAGS